MTTYLFNHMKKTDGAKLILPDNKKDYYREEDYTDCDYIPVELLKLLDQQSAKELKQFDNNSPFRNRKNIQKI